MMNLFRKIVVSFLFIVVVLGAFMTFDEIQADGEIIYYVSPNGDDVDEGTISEPFQTIAKAQAVVRNEIVGGMSANIIVYLRGGVYYLDNPLTFTPLDSGRDGYTVQYLAYHGEEPIIDGGSLMSGWTAVDSNVYKTDVDPGFEFDTLYENGERSDKARHPDKGQIRQDYHTTAAPYISANPKTQFHFEAGDIPAGLDPNDGMEIFIWAGGPSGTWNWNSSIREISDIDYTQRIITLATPTGYEIGPGSRYYIRGSQDVLDAPGEFYLDKTANALYYWPRILPISSQEIAAPNMIQVIGFIGVSDTNLVENIKLEGLTIRNSDYHDKSQGKHAIITLQNTKAITIKDNHIYNSGRHGIHASIYVQDSKISGNWIHDIGYNGVDFGGPSDADTMINNQIINNHIHDVGTLFGHGSGIYLNNAGSNTIAHNRIHDVPRYAISMKNARSKNNLVQNNDVFNVNTDSQDTGIIESWQATEGNIIDHNRIYNSNIHFSYGFGIYLDDASSKTTVSNNVIHDLQQSGNGTLRNPIFAKGEGNQILNNYIINNQAEGGPFRSSSDNLDIVLERNIYYNSGDTVYQLHDWIGDRIESSDYNLLYNDTGTYGITGISGVTDFADWQDILSFKYDQNSLIADPKFMNDPKGDYRIRYDSPAQSLGIEDIDFANMGLLESFIYGDGDDPLEYIYPITISGETLSSISLNGSQPTFDVDVMGRTTTGFIANLSLADINYTSSAPLVATVDSSGLITAVAPGVATITLTVKRDIEELETTLHVLVDDISWKTSTYGTTIGTVDQVEETFTIVTDGADVWGTSDEFTFVYQDINEKYSESMSIITTVDSLDPTDPLNTGAGLMIREDDTAGSHNVMARVLPNGALRFTYRNDANPSTWYQSGTTLSLPITLKLTREADVFTGYYLDSQEVWQQFGQISAVMNGDVLAGIAAFSHDTAQTEAEFSDVSIQRIPQAPTAPWDTATYGTISGYVDEYAGLFTLVTNGSNIWDTSDEFTYVHQDIDETAAEYISMITTVNSLEEIDYNTGAGLMIREDDTAGSHNVMARVIADGGLRFTYRNDANPSTWYQTGPTLSFPITLKLTKESDVFTGYYLDSQEVWQQFGQISVGMSGDVMAGLAAFSYSTTPTEAVFSNVSIDSGLPSGWSNQDIGSVGLTGNVIYDGSTFTVEGSGTDIWGSGSPDEFQYVFTPITGDGEIVARVVSVENTFGNAKAGVMIREELYAGSKYVIANTTPTNQQQTLWRDTTQGTTGYALGAISTQPVWIKLVRSGNTFTSYESTDGTLWALMYSVSVSMDTTVYAGLAVLAMDNAELNTSAFDNVSVDF